MATLKAAYVSSSDHPHLHHIPDNSLRHPRFQSSHGGVNGNGNGSNSGGGGGSFRAGKFMVIGHRGYGMNMLQSSDPKLRGVIKENSIFSFNTAAEFPIDFIEFDVQVTKDDCPVIFHDNLILTADSNGCVVEKRVTEMRLSEFLEYGPQRNPNEVGKNLLRKMKDGRIFDWKVENDQPCCTLQEAFRRVKTTVGFNVELKFDDHIVYQHEYLVNFIGAVLQVVYANARDRPIIFSTFQPDAALLLRKMQSNYPVFFLTNAGNEMFDDSRRNSLEAAMDLCVEGGLQGIVSEARGVFRNPGYVPKIKEANLAILTYGKLNNVPEAVYMQHLMGVEGVIVDLVKDITEAVHKLIRADESPVEEDHGVVRLKMKPRFSETEISFLLKLIPELIQL